MRDSAVFLDGEPFPARAPQPDDRPRSAELAALLASSRDLTGTLDLDELMRRTLDRLQALVGYTGTGIILNEGAAWIARAMRGPFEKVTGAAFPVNARNPLAQRILRTRAAVVIDDAARDPQARSAVLSIPSVASESFGYIRSWMGAPLLVDNEVIGLLFVDHREPGWFTPQRQEIVSAFSDQVAIAVKNARAYQAAQRRVAELNGVQRATRALLETVALDKILDIACREACALITAEASAIFAVDGDAPILARQCGPLVMDVDAIRLVAIGCCDAAMAGERAGAFCEGELAGRSALAVPLIVRDVNIGALCVARARRFGEEERRALALLADNVAMAVNAAELAHQGQLLAVMNERQRLAMDLHDTVTQALYGASLLADAAGLALNGKRYESVASNLHKLQDTVNGAMAAMRVMIYELRPPSLDEGLGVAIERRLAAVETRVGLQVDLTVRDEVELGEDREAQVYWIVIEALNNVIKHAHARAVTVDLRYRPRELVLTIADDGIGIDMAALPERMGLGVTGMRERARSIGGALTLESAPGCGSRVTVVAPLR